MSTQLLATFRQALGGELDGHDTVLRHRFVTADDRALWFQTGLSRALDDRNRPELHGLSVEMTHLKRAEEAQALLADAGRIVSELLDYRVSLQRLAKRVVEQLGDWCVIDELIAPGRLSEVGAAHIDLTRESWVRELERQREVDAHSSVG